MKVAYVITRADAVGGASIHVRDLARAMLERGHQAIVAVGGRGPVTDQLASAGIPFRSLELLQRSIHPLTDLRALSEMTHVLREFDPDLVSTHTAKAGWIGRAACARLGLPVLYTPHGWPIGDRVSAMLGPVFRVAETLASRWASAIICVSEDEKRLALRKGVAPGEKLRVVHNGVHDISAEWRANPGLTPVRICSVARFQAPKDHATLLSALAALRSESWELDLVGTGPLEPKIRNLAEGLGIAERVHFLGYQVDPAPTLAKAQLFVLSSRSEGFPRSVLEAMRAGLPVIASGVGGVGEAVVDGMNGRLVPPGNPESLAAAFHGLLASASERQKLGMASRAAFELRFRAEAMIEKTLAIYATVLERSGESRSESLSGIARQ